VSDSAICVDMGGTTTRVGLCDGERLLPGTIRFPTPKSAAGESIRELHLDRVAEAVQQVRQAGADRAVREVGVALGATVDSTGLVRNASMLWHEANGGFDIAAALSARLGWADLHVANDIAAAAWRYRGLGRFALVTVSTGLAVKVFDDRLAFDHKLILDDDGLGGEIGHVRIDPPSVIAGRKPPWCECGNVSDLCSYTSGPATVRLASLLAGVWVDQWRGSKLHVLCGGAAEHLTTADLAQAANCGDEFTTGVLRVSTRPLAVQILQTSALLGLRQFVVMGGFAHGVGVPWFAALRLNLREWLPAGGWFTGWTDAHLDALVQPSRDGDDSLVGMACLLAARRRRHREVVKPVGVGTTLVRRRAVPRCGREQFAVRVAFAGICGTDLQILRGERGCEPGVPGHECVAQVVEVGCEVHSVAPGQVIVVNPNHPYDEDAKIGHNQPGVLREMVVWDGHLADRGQAVRLPDEGRAEWVLVEPLACAVRSLRPAGGPGRPGRVLVIGGGVSGLLHVLLARHRGARQVLLANRGGQRLRLAVARGLVAADECLTLTGNLTRVLAEATGGRGLDTVVVSVSGGIGPSIVDQLWPVLADGATVHLFGGFLPGGMLNSPDGQAVATHPIRSGRPHPVALADGRTCTLVGSRGASAADFAEALDLCLRTPGLPLAPLVSHVVSLDAVPAVLDELAATGRVAGDPPLRVVVDMSLAGRSVRAVDGTHLPQLGAPS